MRVIFKKVMDMKTLNVEEVIKVALSKDERAIYCLSADNETMIKFVAGNKIPKPIISKAFHDLITLGHYNFTKWDAYARYYVEENKEEGWLLISRFDKNAFKEEKRHEVMAQRLNKGLAETAIDISMERVYSDCEKH